MIWQFNPYAMPLFFAGALSCGLAVYMRSRRNRSDAASFVCLLLLIAEWCLTDGLEYVSADLPSISFWNKAAYLGVSSVPVACLIFILSYTKHDKWLSTRNLILLSIIPITTVLLCWTNEFHHLIYTSYNLGSSYGFLVSRVTFGYAFYVYAIYSYSIVLFGLSLLVLQFTRSHGTRRLQSLILIISFSIPVVGSLLDVADPVFPFDWTPLALAFTGFGFFWAVFRFRLFELMPVAREAIIRNMSDAVIVMDSSDHLAYVNPAGERIFGFGEMIIGKPITVAFEGRGLGFEELANESTEVSLTVDGSQRYFHLSFTRLADEYGDFEGRIGVLRDITDRKRMEAQLLESQRLAAIGETTAWVGHDLRNPLQAMTGTLYVAKGRVASGSPKDRTEALELLDSLDNTVRYMDKIVSDLQDYARPLRAFVLETNVLDVVKLSLSKVKIPENVDVALQIDGQASRATLDTSLFTRVIMNLILNAVQAMPEGGRLTISSSRETGCSFITVQDTGVGIAPENLAKLFSLFFTTKAQGQGLGLPVCKRLIEAQGGTITVQSQLGKGTIVTIRMSAQKRQSPISGIIAPRPAT